MSFIKALNDGRGTHYNWQDEKSLFPWIYTQMQTHSTNDYCHMNVINYNCRIIFWGNCYFNQQNVIILYLYGTVDSGWHLVHYVKQWIKKYCITLHGSSKIYQLHPLKCLFINTAWLVLESKTVIHMIHSILYVSISQFNIQYTIKLKWFKVQQ